MSVPFDVGTGVGAGVALGVAEGVATGVMMGVDMELVAPGEGDMGGDVIGEVDCPFCSLEGLDNLLLVLDSVII